MYNQIHCGNRSRDTDKFIAAIDHVIQLYHMYNQIHCGNSRSLDTASVTVSICCTLNDGNDTAQDEVTTTIGTT